MRRLIGVLLCLCLALYVSLAGAGTPENCQDLNCVRQHIDIIDTQIVQLIGERLKYVKRAGELKLGHQAVRDKAREKAILQTVEQQAMAAGYPPTIALAVFQTILHQSVLFEKKSASHGD